jgi:predicted adenylyl cyclase CyaB
MPRNIEIKARLDDPEAVRKRAEAIATTAPSLIIQADTFFHVPHGRLKLRRFDDGTGELIHYERPDAEGPKESCYTIARVEQPGPMTRILTDALGVRCVVRKTRTLLLVGQTRIHLDQVEGLGSFLELEVVLRPGQGSAEGERIATELMHRMGIHAEDLVSGAYADLLTANPAGAAEAERQAP